MSLFMYTFKTAGIGGLQQLQATDDKGFLGQLAELYPELGPQHFTVTVGEMDVPLSNWMVRRDLNSPWSTQAARSPKALMTAATTRCTK